jgi:uncharacterized protein YyaL (SSP411 family)
VDWYPWGDAAFARAVAENKPVFLSIGYATCHWCHVMEKESFEDQAVADLLNRDYLCIKVDREERPDIDQIYMDVCIRLTGSGGWPLSLFLTPEKKPFFAGTYFPKESKMNRPGLLDYLPLIAKRWRENPAELTERAEQVLSLLKDDDTLQIAGTALTADIFLQTSRQLQQRFDSRYGGFGSAPKFPSPHTLAFLLRRYRQTADEQLLKMVLKTLDAMRLGGLYDQIGFGFHRYSTDAHWLVPHFEKMLYDQAGLAQVYLETYQVTNDPEFARTAREIFTYVLGEMTGDHGGFFSAQDADSEGEEGKYYLWSTSEVDTVLGSELAEKFCHRFNLKPEGNYRDEISGKTTGRNIPHLTERPAQNPNAQQLSTEELEACRKRLFAERNLRIPPLTDDKVLTAWNGMMISALSCGGRILSEQSYITAAESAARFILTTLRKPDGTLLRRYRDGDAAIDAFAEDYAFLAKGMLDLYRATFHPEHLQEAITLAEQLATRFMDTQSGLIYETSESEADLIVRPKNIFDGAHPSTNSIALQTFTRLNLLTGETVWKDRSEALLKGLAPSLHSYPGGFTSALQGAALLLEPTREMVLAGEERSKELKEMIQTADQIFAPETTTLLRLNTKNGAITKIAPFSEQISSHLYPAAAYICENFSCREPITAIEDLASILKQRPLS